MEFSDVIRRRLSVRAYRADPIEEEKLLRVLDAARIAPSACNLQPWHFYVVRDTAIRKELGTAYPQPWFAAAPVIICACGRTDRCWSRADGKSYLDVDVAIAMDHLILAAADEGLSTCWIGAFKPDVVRRVLNLPRDLVPIAMTPLGYAAESPSPRPRQPLGEITTFVG